MTDRLLKQIVNATRRKDFSNAKYFDSEVVLGRQIILNSIVESGSTIYNGIEITTPPPGIDFFVVSYRDNKIIKINASGVITTFHQYVTDEPIGCIIDSINGILYVNKYVSAGNRQVDEFTDLDNSVSSGVATTTTVQASGGKGDFIYSTGEFVWGAVTGVTNSDDGMVSFDVATKVETNYYSATDYDDVAHWPPSTQLYWVESTGSNRLDTTDYDGANRVDRGSLPGFGGSITIPPAHLTGANEYVFHSERQNMFIRRLTGRTSTTRIDWLDLSAASTIKLIPHSIRVNYLDDHLYFVAIDNGGTGTTGLYKIPIQEAAQSESNIIQVANLTTIAPNAVGIPTARLAFAINYKESPLPFMVDVL